MPPLATNRGPSGAEETTRDVSVFTIGMLFPTHSLRIGSDVSGRRVPFRMVGMMAASGYWSI